MPAGPHDGRHRPLSSVPGAGATGAPEGTRAQILLDSGATRAERQRLRCRPEVCMWDRTSAIMDLTTQSLAFDRSIAIARGDYADESGDCARIVSRPDGQALFFLGDVAGHDARAARLARELGGWVSELARSAAPGRLLTMLNRALAVDWPLDVFVSAVCFSFDASTGHGSIAAAGQLAPIVKSARSSWPIPVDAGPPLGVLATHGYDQQAFVLAPGEVLVAVTDGVTDPLASANDLLGLSNLARVVERASPEPAKMCASLLGAVRRAGLRDDATVLALASPVQPTGIPAFVRADLLDMAA